MSLAAEVARAVAVLEAGGLVGLPTETVYGLAADATNGEAVARIYAAKGRPSFNPLIVHVVDLKAAERIGVFDAAARALARDHGRSIGAVLSDLARKGLQPSAVSSGADSLSWKAFSTRRCSDATSWPFCR